jgi:hypothetical protein
MDSHFCTENQIEGSKMEGEVMLKNKTFPGQVPLGTIFPKGIDNFMVPVCLSSTHVGWGTIRLEPTWMSICEAAGYAASIAIRENIMPTEIPGDRLIRLLARKNIMISFFNDLEGKESAPWYAAVQYLGTKGFFGSYDARPNDQLTTMLADAWLSQIEKWNEHASMDMTSTARDIWAAEKKGGGPVSANDFANRLGNLTHIRNISSFMKSLHITDHLPISRGDACRLIFEATDPYQKNHSPDSDQRP